MKKYRPRVEEERCRWTKYRAIDLLIADGEKRGEQRRMKRGSKREAMSVS